MLKWVRTLGRTLPTVALALFAAPRAALACAACYGASDAPMARGMNWGILSLLAIIGVVLACVASFFVYLGVRAHGPSSKQHPGSAESTAKD